MAAYYLHGGRLPTAIAWARRRLGAVGAKCNRLSCAPVLRHRKSERGVRNSLVRAGQHVLGRSRAGEAKKRALSAGETDHRNCPSAETCRASPSSLPSSAARPRRSGALPASDFRAPWPRPTPLPPQLVADARRLRVGLGRRAPLDDRPRHGGTGEILRLPLRDRRHADDVARRRGFVYTNGGGGKCTQADVDDTANGWCTAVDDAKGNSLKSAPTIRHLKGFATKDYSQYTGDYAEQLPPIYTAYWTANGMPTRDGYRGDMGEI